MMRLTGELRPGAVLVENVPGLLKYRDKLDAAFAEMGYRTAWETVTALAAGAPHRRKRVFVLAWRGDAVPPLLRRWTRPAWTPETQLWPTPSASNPNDGEALDSWIARSARTAETSRPVSPPLAIAVQMAEQAVPWPTILASDARGPQVSKARQGDAGNMPLSEAVKTQPWPTILATAARGGGPGQREREGSPKLEHVVQGEAGPWPTPTAGDAKASGSRTLDSSAAHAGTSLTDAVRPDRTKAGVGQGPTPAARDWRSGAGSTEDSHPNKRGTKCLPEVLKGRLNPDWVETLMGFPVGWTDTNSEVRRQPADLALGLLSEPLWPAGWVRQAPDAGPQYDWEPPRLCYSEKPIKGRPARLRQLGNAVCPAEGALALSLLIDQAFAAMLDGYRDARKT